MDIVIYGMNVNENAIAAYHDCVIKPCIGESMEINEQPYMVKQICVSYDKNTVFVFADKYK